jgi:hypothetical protein
LELAARATVSVNLRGLRRRWTSWSDLGEGLLAEGPEPVVAAAGELAGD